jgi:hypothetical protein
MKNYSHRIVKRSQQGIAALLLIVSLLIHPHSVQAALGILSVTPNTIAYNTTGTISIVGSDFMAGAYASLTNNVNLATTFVNDTTLSAVVPAGLLPGMYALTVTNPDQTSATLANALQIIAPTAPPVTEEPTATVEPGTSYQRPVIVVQAYSTSLSPVKWGQDFELKISLYNAGQTNAMNIVATFLSSEVTPRETGGVIAVAQLAPGNRANITQPMTVNYSLWGLYSASIDLNLSYTDGAGIAYTETFKLSVPLQPPVYTATTPTPTPTTAPLARPQLVITSYTTDIPLLQPGAQFNLELILTNLGNSTAERVTMIVGGGSISISTETPGGVSGGSGEFTNFAPLGASNIQSIGDLEVGKSITAHQPLVVNVSTAPGAYPLKISFTYLNENGQVVVDEQVITLLIYSLPRVDISFYSDPNPIFAGQENMLPIQIVNLGKNYSVLGNMTVTTSQGQVFNNSLLVGSLEPGGYFTLDASLIPDTPGPLDLIITVDYTDDFNQARKIEQKLTLDVQEMIIPEEPLEPYPGQGEGEIPIEQPETFWQKVLRFLLGLLGLDSSRPQPEVTNEMISPIEEEPIPVPEIIVPIKGP